MMIKLATLLIAACMPHFAVAAALDGQPWQFVFSGLTAGIDHIVVDFTGTKPAGIGLAFNNFYPFSIPEPSTGLLLLGSLTYLGLRRN